MGDELSKEHEIVPDGESTEKWAFRDPGFMGTLKQLTHCARCGEHLPVSDKSKPRFYFGIGKPTFHTLCDDCFDVLPD